MEGCTSVHELARCRRDDVEGSVSCRHTIGWAELQGGEGSATRAYPVAMRHSNRLQQVVMVGNVTSRAGSCSRFAAT